MAVTGSEARGEISRWWSETEPPDWPAKRNAHRQVRENRPLSPQIPVVIFHEPLFQEPEVFLLKRRGAVVLLLTEDVRPDFYDMGGADGESPIAFLPVEPGQAEFAVNPWRGVAFYFAHDVREAMGGAQSGEDVDVVRGAADRVRHAIHAPEDATEIAVNTRELFRREVGRAVFGAEDEMVVEREVCGWHGRMVLAHLPARNFSFCGIRWFRCAPPPANLCHASGVGSSGQAPALRLACRISGAEIDGG